MDTRIASVLRNQFVESVHHGAMAVADAQGRVLASVGDPHFVTYLRSSAKPFQTMALITAGAVSALQLTEEEIAIASASHSAEADHQRVVLSLLQKAGCSIPDLQCGVHAPKHEATAQALQQAGIAPSSLHHNCSGKHAGMLAHARALSADIGSYLEPDHPVQQRIRAVTESVLGETTAAIGTDGCSVPVLAFPLSAMARGYARLLRPETLPTPEREAAIVVAQAMRNHPHLVAGSGRFDTRLMRATQGTILAKSGAEAVFCMAHAPSGLGLACKVLDGSDRPLAAFVMSALTTLGWLSDEAQADLADLAAPKLYNSAGKEIGEITVTATLAQTP